MKHWLLILTLPLWLAGCVLEGFELPQNYRPSHPGATAPLADRAVFHAKLDDAKGGETWLRFIKTGAVSYVMETFARPSNGEPPLLLPMTVRFVPLDARHYALYWRLPTPDGQGYALVRLDAGKLVTLTPPASKATVALAERHGLTASRRLTGGYTLDDGEKSTGLDALDDARETRVLAFLKALAARKDLQARSWASRPGVPDTLSKALLTRLGPHIVRMEGGNLIVSQLRELAAYFRARADQGDPWAHYALARFALNGWGMEIDPLLARVAADAAIRGGVVEANQVLAAMHYYGIGQPATPAAAIPYARRAADVGVPAAMHLLGVAYRDGQGVAADKAEARRWLRAAADAGHADAHAMWADLMLDDQTAASDAQAITALEAGMKAGAAHAFYLRGFMHENGRGGAQDFAAATAMFLEAAKLRHDYATYLAGERLRRGQGIPQDIIRGRKLVARAAEKGIKEAEAALERTDKVLTGNICVRGMCGNSQANAKPNPNLEKPPYVFAGLRYGAPYQDAIRLFGKPERIESSGASTELFWSSGKFEVSYRKDTGFINSFTIVGQEGVAFVRSHAPKEGTLKLLDLPAAKVADVMGKPTKIWYHDTRMDWRYEIDQHRQGSIFLECTRGKAQTCDQMTVHWSGRITWDPNDGVDSWGLRMSPICGTANAYRNANTRRGFVLSSEKAQTPVWELELFTNAATRNWVLAGKYRDTSVWTATPSSRELCELAQGEGDYRTQKWYGAYFGPSSVALSEQAAEPEYDSYGLRSNPTCGHEQITERYFVKIRNQPPSGIKAENDKWKMEIYANKETGDWVVLGRSKTADADQTKLCGLAVGQGSYEQFKWYREYFAKKPVHTLR